MTILANLQMKNPEQIPDILHQFRGKCLRVGFSGGADSTALLLLLLHWGWLPEELHAVHFEHGLRGEASRDDARWCRNFCLERGIPFTVVELNLGERSDFPGSIEDIARSERLMWYRKHDDGTPVVLAHHAGDADENLLLKLARGGSSSAVSSLRSCRKLWDLTILRPLLEYSKAELEDFLRNNGVNDWRHDASNDSCDYHRNFLRNKLLPEWQSYHAPLLAGLAQSRKLLAMDADFIEEMAAEKFAELGTPPPERTRLDFWQSLHPALLGRVLRKYLAALTGKMDETLSAAVISHLTAMLKKDDFSQKCTVELGSGRYMILHKDYCFFTREASPLPLPEKCVWNWKIQPVINYCSWQLSAEVLPGAVSSAEPDAWYFNADTFPETLYLDIRRGGETMTVWGENTPRRVKHLLCSCPDKDQMIILRDGNDNIVALGNWRRSNLYGISANCTQSVKITAKALD